MPTGYIDPATVHTPTPGAEPPSVWGRVINHSLRFLAAPPQASITGVAQVVTGGQATYLTGSVVNYDHTPEPLWDPEEPDRLTIHQSGVYTVAVTVRADAFGVSNASWIITDLVVNDSLVWVGDARILQPDPVTTRVSLLRVIHLLADDIIQVRLNHSRPGGRTCVLDELAVAWRRRPVS